MDRDYTEALIIDSLLFYDGRKAERYVHGFINLLVDRFIGLLIRVLYGHFKVMNVDLNYYLSCLWDSNKLLWDSNKLWVN